MANIIVSGCLLGCDCRYKGDNCKCEELLELAEKHTLIPVCPEQLGGLKTPRDPSEIVGDKVISNHGKDVTYEYTKGAEMALYILLEQADVQNARKLEIAIYAVCIFFSFLKFQPSSLYYNIFIHKNHLIHKKRLSKRITFLDNLYFIIS